MIFYVYLQLCPELSSLVWSLPTEQAKEMLQLTSESFVDAVNDALVSIAPVLGALSVTNS